LDWWHLILSDLVQPPGLMGCDPVLQDGRTALHVAAQSGHVYVVKKLLDAGARVDIISNVRSCMAAWQQ
jgi:ankyrin repeat protein